MPTEVQVNYDILRRVAEVASGHRYHDIWIVVTDDGTGGLVIKVFESPPEVRDGDAVFMISKVTYAPPPAVNVSLIGSGTTIINLLDVEVPPQQLSPGGRSAADAVFWSQSAVEKFLLPYYASVYGDHADTIVHELLHVLKPDEAEADPAFAIAHLPSSEYVTVEETRLFKIRQSGTMEPVGQQAASGGS